eukprot:m.533941 g.533941  ORF g.533941 m.533941 type:complete len:87 (+) comp22052_c0_seq27:2599-2859(+)
MQRWGAALWSGDTRSVWASLKVSVQAALNTQLSGIAWWTTDIGGYAGGDPNNDDGLSHRPTERGVWGCREPVVCPHREDHCDAHVV